MFTDWEISRLHIIPPHAGSTSYFKDKEVPPITSFPENHFSSCFTLSCWVDQWDNLLLRVDYQHHCKPKRQVISHWIHLCLSPWDYLAVQALPSLTFRCPPNFWHLSYQLIMLLSVFFALACYYQCFLYGQVVVVMVQIHRLKYHQLLSSLICMADE